MSKFEVNKQKAPPPFGSRAHEKAKRPVLLTQNYSLRGYRIP